MNICLFAKAPRSGSSKTRLAPALGADGAAALARALLFDALATWRAAQVELIVATTGDMDNELAAILGELPRIEQEGQDLGARMEAALRAGLARSELAVVVGSDMPALGPAYLQDLEHAMRRHDAAMVPAEDGGFGLLALRRCPPGLLRDLPWSQSSTLARTKERLEQEGLRVALLAESFDVDRPSDLPKLAELVREQSQRLHHTRAFLASPQNQAISVIVPVLNEAKHLPAQLASLLRDPALCEIIVVDGGSNDESQTIAAQHPGVRLLRSAPGRARQMNAGARAAMGGTLLFLHADTQLPATAGSAIRRAMQTGQSQAGAFRIQTRYDPQGRHRPWIKALLPLADLRSHYSALPYGDQALFVRAKLFWNEGGFADLPLFEDLELSKRLHAHGPLQILPGPVLASARRFQERPFYYAALMNTLPLLYRLGVSPQRLERWYRSQGRANESGDE